MRSAEELRLKSAALLLGIRAGRRRACRDSLFRLLSDQAAHGRFQGVSYLRQAYCGGIPLALFERADVGAIHAQPRCYLSLSEASCEAERSRIRADDLPNVHVGM